MTNVLLGRTGIRVQKQSFGCLPIQRIPKADAVSLLRQAVAGGMNFFDTARAYTDSEEKVGEAFKERHFRTNRPPKSADHRHKNPGTKCGRDVEGSGNQP